MPIPGRVGDPLRRAGSHHLPRRLLLIRHGESKANVNDTLYSTTPDWRIELTKVGHQQAFQCGQVLRRIIQDERLFLYYSPYIRTRQTLEEIRKSLCPSQILGECEDERLREQEIGNYQPIEKMSETWQERNDYGRLYYRFPCGESGADVGDRVSCFFNSFLRMNIELTGSNRTTTRSEEGGVKEKHDEATNEEEEGERHQKQEKGAVGMSSSEDREFLGGKGERNVGGCSSFLENSDVESDCGVMPPASVNSYDTGDRNVAVVSHGLLIRLFISRWFNMPVELTETLNNPPNCSIVVLERKDGIGNLVMTDASKALFGNDSRLQLMKFDEQMTKVYQKKLISGIDLQRRVGPKGV
ncbi:unnamed protein product [Phytomonas sp. Hart1]|nr:unnamed protein product [Phytomonas sp. Hart1]|eukprot:CCW71476.1 unnamed protein product [Phytomonas sp. isolate Hart1]